MRRLLLLLVALLAALDVCLAAADFYKILGVKKSASDREIKKAYRTLSKKYHPDKSDDPDAETKFLEIGKAYDALSDPEKRSIYDKYGEEGLNQQAQGGGGGFHDPFDLFRQAFGGGFGGGGFGGFGGGGGGVRRGPNMLAEMEVELESVYKGDSLKFTIERRQVCEKCDGSGARSAKDVTECSACDGRGIRLVRQMLGPGIVTQMQTTCDKCGGRGKTIKHKCSACKGERIVNSKVDLTLDIDRGLPEGSELVFEGESDETPDYEAGDVVVRVRSRQKPGGFIRRGIHLFWKENLTVQEALLGFTRSVTSLDGHDVLISRSEPTQPGFVQRVEGEGMPVYHESGHGDLYVEYSVELPQTLSPQLRADLENAFGYKPAARGSKKHSEL